MTSTIPVVLATDAVKPTINVIQKPWYVNPSSLFFKQPTEYKYSWPKTAPCNQMLASLVQHLVRQEKDGVPAGQVYFSESVWKRCQVDSKNEILDTFFELNKIEYNKKWQEWCHASWVSADVFFEDGGTLFLHHNGRTGGLFKHLLAKTPKRAVLWASRRYSQHWYLSDKVEWKSSDEEIIHVDET